MDETGFDEEQTDVGPLAGGPQAASQLAPAEVIASWTIVRSLGVGPSEGLYLARDTSDQLGALKALSLPNFKDAVGLARFVERARRATRLPGPRFVEILEYIQDGSGTWYCVMEPALGESVRARARREPLTLADCVWVVSQVAEALTELHRNHAVHGAITPSTVFLGEGEGAQGHVKLLDFGVWPGQQVLLPPLRLAPEQGRLLRELEATSGPPTAVVDARTDVYLLGGLLFEMLEGRPIAVTRELSVSNRAYEVVPARLRKVVRQAISETPKERFSTVAAFAAAVREAVIVSLPKPGASGATHPLVRTTRRPALKRWAPVPVALALLGLAVWALWPAPPPPVVVPPPPPPPVVVAPKLPNPLLSLQGRDLAQGGLLGALAPAKHPGKVPKPKGGAKRDSQ